MDPGPPQPLRALADFPHDLPEDSRKWLCVLLGNIVQNPDEPRYRMLKFNNKSMRKLLASSPSVQAVLSAVGFVQGEDRLELPQHSSLDQLRAALHSLGSTTAVARPASPVVGTAAAAPNRAVSKEQRLRAILETRKVASCTAQLPQKDQDQATKLPGELNTRSVAPEARPFARESEALQVEEELCIGNKDCSPELEEFQRAMLLLGGVTDVELRLQKAQARRQALEQRLQRVDDLHTGLGPRLRAATASVTNSSGSDQKTTCTITHALLVGALAVLCVILSA